MKWGGGVFLKDKTKCIFVILIYIVNSLQKTLTGAWYYSNGRFHYVGH